MSGVGRADPTNSNRLALLRAINTPEILMLSWTTSPVEGQNSRLKMLKRTMYGRAGTELVRARVLHAA
jgi:hypothetical protein